MIDDMHGESRYFHAYARGREGLAKWVHNLKATSKSLCGRLGEHAFMHNFE